MLVEYLVRGVKAGAVAGVAFGLFVALVANPLVGFADDRAHAAGADGDHVADHGGGDGLPAAVTDAVSVASGALWGLFLGAAGFGVAFYLLEPIVPGRAGVDSYVFGLAGFLTVSGAPWLVLPPTVPGVERALDPTMGSLLYVGLVLAGGVACVAGMAAYDRLRPEWSRSAATLAATAPYGLLVVAAAAAPTDGLATATESALEPALASGLVGVVVFGQALVWLLLAAVHARLRDDARPTDRPDGSGLPDGAPAGER
ncbi:hypothetical protein BRC97_13265 [Halobacteriales archaeon QS_6_71_20]|nr:MAG: hypothetical protein BRC97_13265 [Halobacteriales archaeon QS_6_71_20]